MESIGIYYFHNNADFISQSIQKEVIGIWVEVQK